MNIKKLLPAVGIIIFIYLLSTIDLGKINPGDVVGIFGCGPIGLMILQLARLSGSSEIPGGSTVRELSTSDQSTICV